MPELPEVETIRRTLEPKVRGRVITGVRVARADVIGYPETGREFARRLAGRTIRSLSRRGKYLVFNLSGGAKLVVHLRLSGRLAAVRRRSKVKFERVRLRLDNGDVLSFVEPRALGRMYCLLSSETPSELAGMRAMGLEPIEPEFDCDYLAGRLKGRKTCVKSVLLDQRVCSGVGNIYSDEALFRAGIRPTRRAGSLRRFEVRRLANALRQVLDDGIKWCGTTMGDGRYLMPDGREGGFQRHLAAFGREGLQCRRCRATIVATRLAGRTSRFCPACQR